MGNYKITREKFFILVIIAALIYSGSVVFGVFATTQNKKYTPSPMRVSSLYIKLECQSNEDFITEDSSMKCYTAIVYDNKSRIIRGYVYVDIIVQAVESDNTTNILWGCRSLFYNVSSSYTNSTLCENYFYDNVFKQEKSGTIKFKIRSVQAEGYDGVGIDFYGDEFFKKDMIILSKNEAFSAKVADNNYKIAVLALLLFVPTLVFETRKFLKN